ncbi:uncharacterized protein LODBEIA_P60910 [Lodderomyces beijingensis]|uniref:Uncharacterized protein n=1 Tax=Lodderomyces beijingensis TaxID=1775926 RepID=A0ABP0ZX58_9ASCO
MSITPPRQKSLIQAPPSPHYRYGTHHRRSDSIDLGRRGSDGLVLSAAQPRRNSYVSFDSPPGQVHSEQAHKWPGDSAVVAEPIIDLDRITEEYKRDRQSLAQKQVNWCKFLKEHPIDADIYLRNSRSSSSSQVDFPQTSEMLLDKYNTSYNIESDDDNDDDEDEDDENSVKQKEKPAKRVLKKLKSKLT